LNTTLSFGDAVLFTIAQDCLFEVVNPFFNGPQGVFYSLRKNARSTINVSVTGFGTHYFLRCDTLIRVFFKPIYGYLEQEETNRGTLVVLLSIVKASPNWQ
jgi:hypothetical protein